MISSLSAFHENITKVIEMKHYEEMDINTSSQQSITSVSSFHAQRKCTLTRSVAETPTTQLVVYIRGEKDPSFIIYDRKRRWDGGTSELPPGNVVVSQGSTSIFKEILVCLNVKCTQSEFNLLSI